MAVSEPRPPSTGENAAPEGIPESIDAGLYSNPDTYLPDLSIIHAQFSIEPIDADPSDEEPVVVLGPLKHFVRIPAAINVPDLLSRHFDFGPDVAIPSYNAHGLVQATVRNIVTAPTGNADDRTMPPTTATLRVVRRSAGKTTSSPDGTVLDNQPLATVQLPELKQGEWRHINLQTKFERIAGATYTLVLDVNPDRLEAEFSYENNTRSASYLDFPGAQTTDGTIKPLDLEGLIGEEPPPIGPPDLQ
jgi:hypothetical protein